MAAIRDFSLVLFLSTPSARRATVQDFITARRSEDFYPRPPRGGRLNAPQVQVVIKVISIHALREEGDRCSRGCASARCYFYPRPPRGGRLNSALPMWMPSKFLSTPSARRATKFRHEFKPLLLHFYPRPPRGGRQQKQRQNLYFLINYTTFCTNLEEP